MPPIPPLRRHISLGALAVLTGIGATPADAGAARLLPDLYNEAPYGLTVEGFRSPDGGATYHLGFGSRVYNEGRGPLRIEGSRPSTEVPEMNATQVVANSNGSETRRPGIGAMRYVDSKTHRHWHYLRFNTYELRGLDGKLVGTDRKTGFCLGDRSVAHEALTLRGQPSTPVFKSGCGYDSPELLTMTEGISVNYADSYDAQLEGQFVDMTGVPAGRYLIVNHVNADRKLVESDYSDNRATALVEVSYPGGPTVPPAVVLLDRCPGSAKCPVAPELTKRKASGFARQAFGRAFDARSPRVSCAAPKRGRDRCTGTWRGGSGVVRIRYAVSSGELYWTYAATASGERRSERVAVPFKSEPVPYSEPGAGKRKLAYCPLSARG
jgi:hypothetical protein